MQIGRQATLVILFGGSAGEISNRPCLLRVDLMFSFLNRKMLNASFIIAIFLTYEKCAQKIIVKYLLNYNKNKGELISEKAATHFYTSHH